MVNRYYRVQGININELDADGSNLPMMLKNMRSEELRHFEKWCKEAFGVVFSVESNVGRTIPISGLFKIKVSRWRMCFDNQLGEW